MQISYSFPIDSAEEFMKTLFFFIFSSIHLIYSPRATQGRVNRLLITMNVHHKKKVHIFNQLSQHAVLLKDKKSAWELFF